TSDAGLFRAWTEPSDRRRPRQAGCVLLPDGLLDVVERGEAGSRPRLHACRLVSGRHGRLDLRGAAGRGARAARPAAGERIARGTDARVRSRKPYQHVMVREGGPSTPWSAA